MKQQTTQKDLNTTQKETSSLHNGEQPKWFEECPQHGRYLFAVEEDGAWKVLNPECPECRKKRQARQLKDRLGVPRRFEKCTVNGYQTLTPEQAKVKQLVVNYCKDIETKLADGVNGIFFGGVGTGKTHLACAIGQRAKDLGRTVKFTSARKILLEIRSSWGRCEGESEFDILKRYAAHDLLIIDEVGAHKGSENEINILFDVINSRYEDMKSTLIITNLALTPDGDKPTLKDYLGERLYDRLTEDGSLIAGFNWSSYRHQKEQRKHE